MGVPNTNNTSPFLLTSHESFINDLQPKEDNDLLLQSISHNINEAIYRSVHNNGLVYINVAFAKMFGYESTIEILNGEPINLYADPNDRQRLAAELTQHGALSNKEVRFRKKDGSVFCGSLSSIMVEGRDGVTYFDGAIRDISAEKEAEKKLKYQSDMQRTLINISSKYINLPLESVDETIHETLKSLGCFLGIDKIQIHEYDFEESVCTTTYEWYADGISPVIEHQASVPFKEIEEMMCLHFEGKDLYVPDVDSLSQGPVRSKLKDQGIKSILTVPMMLENCCVGFISIESIRSTREYTSNESSMIQLFANMSVNITSRAQDQKRLHKLLETTSIQNQRLKDFSQITSHNIRASVANLIALNSLLQTDPIHKGYLESLDVTVGRLNTSINNLNSLLNFDNANELLEKKDCNIALSINRVIRHNYQSIQEKELKITKNIPEKLIGKAFPIYLDGIFHHIISNAIKYGTSKDAKQIVIESTETADSITISVSDFGRGIDLTRYGAKLFKAGVRFQAHECEGQGMGLFITKYMVEAMKGQISVKSEPNKGCSFMVSFRKP